MLQVFFWHSPQPEVLVTPGLHSPVPEHALHTSHAQVPLQERLWVPQLPQARVSLAPAAQLPSPLHPVHPPQAQVSLHARVFWPQFPHGLVSFVPGSQVPGSEPQAWHMPRTQV